MKLTDQPPKVFLHTPGPWDCALEYIVAPDPTGRHPDIYIAEIVDTDDEGRVAPPKQRFANRQLIAAAPELLAAVRAMISAIGNLDAAMDGVTDQFDAEWSHVYVACTDGLGALLKATLPPSELQP